LWDYTSFPILKRRILLHLKERKGCGGCGRKRESADALSVPSGLERPLEGGKGSTLTLAFSRGGGVEKRGFKEKRKLGKPSAWHPSSELVRPQGGGEDKCDSSFPKKESAATRWITRESEEVFRQVRTQIQR